MSEKRFIFATNEKRFNLDDESRIWDNGTPMTALDIVVMLNEQQAEIERLKKPILKDNQETEVKECQFCGEFRTEYHEYEDYSWSAKDYCNAGHDLEDTDPNTCKDYWDDD